MKQAFRLISRMKGYTALSLLGLVISLSGTVIIARYLHQEWTIDHWMPDLDRTYVLMEERSGDNPYPAMFYKSFLGRAELQSPLDGQNEIEYFSYASTYTTLQLKLDEGEMLKPLALKADSMFHRFFPLKAVAGTLVLRHEGDAIISEELSARLFPEGEAVGQTLTTDNGQLRTVIGVFRKPASKLSLNFDYVEYEAEDPFNNQGNVFYMVRLHPGASVKTYNKRQPVQTPNVFEMEGRTLRFQLAPYEGLLSQLWGEKDVTVRSVSSPKYLWMLFAVAVLLFLVGIFNFLNLFAVMRSHRRHELCMMFQDWFLSSRAWIPADPVLREDYSTPYVRTNANGSVRVVVPEFDGADGETSHCDEFMAGVLARSAASAGAGEGTAQAVAEIGDDPFGDEPRGLTRRSFM